jgi:hypothetical protein
MDKYGISKSILSISAPGVYFKDKNLELANELSRQTNDICIGLINDIIRIDSVLSRLCLYLMLMLL